MKKTLFFLSSFAFALLLVGCGKTDPLDQLAEIVVDETSTTGTLDTGALTDADDILDAQMEIEQGGGSYLQYSKVDFEDAMANDKRIILYFHDNKSVTCKSFKKDVSRHEANIPEDVVIFEIDFASDSSLIKKHNIKRSNSFIFLDDKGKEDKRMSTGILKLEEILKVL